MTELPISIKVKGLVLEVPSTKSVSKIMSGFEKTGLYSKKFLKDLETGLKTSDYFKK